MSGAAREAGAARAGVPAGIVRVINDARATRATMTARVIRRILRIAGRVCEEFTGGLVESWRCDTGERESARSSRVAARHAPGAARPAGLYPLGFGVVTRSEGPGRARQSSLRCEPGLHIKRDPAGKGKVLSGASRP